MVILFFFFFFFFPKRIQHQRNFKRGEIDNSYATYTDMFAFYIKSGISKMFMNEKDICVPYLLQTFGHLTIFVLNFEQINSPSILHKPKAGRYRSVRVADGPITGTL